MHPSSSFYERDSDTLIARAQAHPFALVTSVLHGRPVAAHAPVLTELKQGAPQLRFHLARANPVCQALETGAPCLIIFTGDHAYISPDWYGTPDQVGTWNYLSVEAEGAVEQLNENGLIQLLDDLSDTHEAPLAPKPKWTRAKMSPDKFERMLPAIRGFALSPTRFEGITKLNQNKPATVRANTSLELRKTKSGIAIADEMDKLAL